MTMMMMMTMTIRLGNESSWVPVIVLIGPYTSFLVPVAGASCRQPNRTCAILKPTGTSSMTHTPVCWCKLTGTGYLYQKTGQCEWPLWVDVAKLNKAV